MMTAGNTTRLRVSSLNPTKRYRAITEAMVRPMGAHQAEHGKPARRRRNERAGEHQMARIQAEAPFAREGFLDAGFLAVGLLGRHGGVLGAGQGVFAVRSLRAVGAGAVAAASAARAARVPALERLRRRLMPLVDVLAAAFLRAQEAVERGNGAGPRTERLSEHHAEHHHDGKHDERARRHGSRAEERLERAQRADGRDGVRTEAAVASRAAEGQHAHDAGDERRRHDDAPCDRHLRAFLHRFRRRPLPPFQGLMFTPRLPEAA